MAVRPVIRMGHPGLRTPAQPYPAELIDTTEFHTLIEDMRETLHASGGIGLAAPQIDVGYRIAVIEIEQTETRYGTLEQTPFGIYINPKITPLEEESAGYWEGCLSVPGLMGYVERPQHIRVDYTDEHGQPAAVEAHGFLATVFQHEFDHLDGILYIDRMTDKSRFAFEEEYMKFWVQEPGSE